MKSHHFGCAEARHLNAPMVMAVEMKAVEWSQQPQIDTRDPHQHCVLETLGKVWIGSVPCTVPVLYKIKEKKKTQIDQKLRLVGNGSIWEREQVKARVCWQVKVVKMFLQFCLIFLI